MLHKDKTSFRSGSDLDAIAFTDENMLKGGRYRLVVVDYQYSGHELILRCDFWLRRSSGGNFTG